MQATMVKATLQTSTYSYNWDAILDEAEFVAFDTENNGHINLFDNGVVVHGFSIAVKIRGVYLAEYFPCYHSRGDNYDRAYWEPILRKVLTKKLICHNVNFDARSARLLLNEDLDKPFDYFFDTTRMGHILDENAYDSKQGGKLSKPSLENCCLYFLGKPGKVKSVIFNALMSLYGWSGIAPTEIREYAEADAIAAYELWEFLARKLANEKDADNINYWKKLEMPNMQVTYSMKHLGVGIDIPFCAEWQERCEANMYRLRAELGFDPNKPTELKPIIYDVLKLPVITNKKTGKPTLDKAAMEKYDKMLEASDNPLARKISEYRGWSKAVSSYYRPYQELIDPDGRLRPEFKSHGTLNGRYACVNPNLQQIPKSDPELEELKPWSAHVKECFIPMQGHELWEFDYSQLELRLGAVFGKDKKLLEIFNDPSERDIFTEMSAVMGWPRQQVKGFVYSIDYGAGPGRIADVFKLGSGPVALGKAKQLIEEFYEMYPGLGAANDKAKWEAERTGRLKYWAGHYRHFPDRTKAYKAFNSKIQGGSADLVKKVMNNIRRELPEVRMLLQVHDALWFEFPQNKVAEYSRDVVRIMEDPFDGDKSVIFKVDGHRVGGKSFVGV